MTSAGYPLADITNGEIHHSHYVKMGLSYQQGIYLLQFPEQWNVLQGPIVLTLEEFELMTEWQQAEILSQPNHYVIKE